MERRQNENLSRIIAGILLIGLGTGLLFLLHSDIVANAYGTQSESFVFGFFGGALIATGLALILWGNRG